MELSLRRHLLSPARANAEAKAAPAETSVRRQNLVILGAALVAFMLKLAIAYNTFGTNDVAAFYMFAGSLREHGLEWTYRNGVIFFSNFPIFNHPPLTAYYLELIANLSKNPLLEGSGITFPFLLRTPGIIADFISVIVLTRMRETLPDRQIPQWGMLLFAWSPVSIMVSGFHGNTDSIMTMFLLVAAYMCLREQPVLCGIFFALSCQIKIIPLLFLPIPLFFWLKRETAMRFVVPFIVLNLALWIQPLTQFPLLFFRNVFSYNGYWGGWGISYWLKLTQWTQFDGNFFNLPPGSAIVAQSLKIGIICAVIVIAWRRRHLSEDAVFDSFAYGWIVFFAFAPSICPQYLVWLAPFILFLSPKCYGWLTISAALALFFLYNDLTGGLPWYIGIARNNPNGASPTGAWMIWPWATLFVGMLLFWRNALMVTSASRVKIAIS
jgi:uncharacterized membrane protein